MSRWEREDYWRGEDGTVYTFADMELMVREQAPETLGEHISVQLEALGLYEQMRLGTTPCALPFTFASRP